MVILSMSRLFFDMSYSIDLDVFIDNYVHNIQKVDKRLDEYIKDPDEENIHDIRTAIRRLEASYSASPKQIRKKRIEKYVDTSKHLFKLNSEIRDFDIILEKLNKEGQMDEQQIEILNKSIKRQKNRKLNKALSIAIELRKLNAPHLDNDNNLYDRCIMQKKLIKRYKNVVGKFVCRMERNFPIVINNSEKIDELHEIRKDSKKLRYLLELVLSNKDRIKGNIDKNDVINKNDHGDNHDVSFLLKKLEKLEKIQDMLGNIHDYDITTAYLKGHNSHNFFIAENNIAMKRKNKYEQFVQYCKSDLLDTENNSFIRI
jgi:CHAD domain-containing protein